MKKIILYLGLIIVLVFCLVAIMSTVAFAADGTESPPVIGDFYSWEVIITSGGCMMATLALTQFFKSIWPQAIPTQFLSYFIALLILLAANYFTGVLTWETGIISILNAIVIALAANGGYNNIKEINNSAKT